MQRRELVNFAGNELKNSNKKGATQSNQYYRKRETRNRFPFSRFTIAFAKGIRHFSAISRIDLHKSALYNVYVKICLFYEKERRI